MPLSHNDEYNFSITKFEKMLKTNNIFFFDSVEFENIIPTSISALEFDSTVSNPDAMVATATFQYTTYEIINLS